MMKIQGVINRDLIACLTELGHTDSFMICDAGFPIPNGAIRVDLALVAGLPDFQQCLDAVLKEIVVEKIAIAEEMAAFNNSAFKFVENLFVNQVKNILPQAQLVEISKQVKFYVRTGELAPYSNIILTAASGVDEYRQQYYIGEQK